MTGRAKRKLKSSEVIVHSFVHLCGLAEMPPSIGPGVVVLAVTMSLNARARNAGSRRSGGHAAPSVLRRSDDNMAAAPRTAAGCSLTFTAHAGDRTVF